MTKCLIFKIYFAYEQCRLYKRAAIFIYIFNNYKQDGIRVLCKTYNILSPKKVKSKKVNTGLFFKTNVKRKGSVYPVCLDSI